MKYKKDYKKQNEFYQNNKRSKSAIRFMKGGHPVKGYDQIFTYDSEGIPSEAFDKAMQEAKDNKWDILSTPHTICNKINEWNIIRKRGVWRLKEGNIYEMSKIFIDIDMNYYQNIENVRKGLSDLGIANYDIYKSASDNIHCYINIKKTQNKEKYTHIVKGLIKYFEKYEIEIDPASKRVTQLVYLEEFRVLSKGGGTSEYMEGKQGRVLSLFAIEKKLVEIDCLKQPTRSYRYAMYKILEAVEYEAFPSRLNLSELARKYLIPQSTMHEAMRRLGTYKAIIYKSREGSGGYYEISKIDIAMIKAVKDKTITRRQAWMRTILYIIKNNFSVFSFFLHNKSTELSDCNNKNVIFAYRDYWNMLLISLLGIGISGVGKIKTAKKEYKSKYKGSGGRCSVESILERLKSKRIEKGKRFLELRRILGWCRFRGNLSRVDVQQVANRLLIDFDRSFTRMQFRAVVDYVNSSSGR